MTNRTPLTRMARRIEGDLERQAQGRLLHELRLLCCQADIEEIGGRSIDSLRGVGGIGLMEDALGLPRSEFGLRAAPVDSTVPDIFARMERGQILEELRDLNYRGKLTGRTEGLRQILRTKTAKVAS